MKLLTPNGCRNTRGQVCCIAIAACNAVQQLAGYCTQPWPALNGQYMCTTCAPNLAVNPKPWHLSGRHLLLMKQQDLNPNLEP